MKKYKAIFLDWDDTIGDWATAEHRALQDIYANYRLDLLYATFEDYLAAYKPYNMELWGKYGRGEITKDYLHFERFFRPLATPHSPLATPQLAEEIGNEFLSLTNKYFSLLPDAAETVRRLADRYPLTIISNGFKEVQYYKFEHSGLKDCFVHIIISEEAGINKPQPGIFRIALDLNNVDAGEAVMIGDSYSSDIEGARAAGIDQIWLHKEANGEAATNGQTATYTVTNLKEVMRIL